MKHNVSRTVKAEGRLRLTELCIRVPGLPPALRGLTAVQLSDLHHGRYTPKETVQQALDLAQSLRPDIYLITGDFIDTGRRELSTLLFRAMGGKAYSFKQYRTVASVLAAELADMLSTLSAPLGVYGVRGNHDYTEGIKLINRHIGEHVQILVNESVAIWRNGVEFLLSGVDDFKEGTPQLDRMTKHFLNPEPKQDQHFPLRILLAHNPDTILLPEGHMMQEYDLILSGHTHGGQICLPGQIPVRTATRQRKYASGFKRFGGTAMYISNGVGNSALPMRAFCPPEVVHITFEAQP